MQRDLLGDGECVKGDWGEEEENLLLEPLQTKRWDPNPGAGRLCGTGGEGWSW